MIVGALPDRYPDGQTEYGGCGYQQRNHHTIRDSVISVDFLTGGTIRQRRCFFGIYFGF